MKRMPRPSKTRARNKALQSREYRAYRNSKRALDRAKRQMKAYDAPTSLSGIKTALASLLDELEGVDTGKANEETFDALNEANKALHDATVAIAKLIIVANSAEGE